MNSIMKEQYPLFKMYQALRNQMMEILSDEDLEFRLPGNNATLGALCREIGEVQTSYIQSFKTFAMDFSYRNEAVGLDGSVSKLSTWYAELDRELESTIKALSQDDIDTRKIDRGEDFVLSPSIQLEIYKEALLIFYGKSSVYLKALEKELPLQWRQWIS